MVWYNIIFKRNKEEEHKVEIRNVRNLNIIRDISYEVTYSEFINLVREFEFVLRDLDDGCLYAITAEAYIWCNERSESYKELGNKNE